jgi:hypothetical protein
VWETKFHTHTKKTGKIIVSLTPLLKPQISIWKCANANKFTRLEWSGWQALRGPQKGRSVPSQQTCWCRGC